MCVRAVCLLKEGGYCERERKRCKNERGRELDIGFVRERQSKKPYISFYIRDKKHKNDWFEKVKII